MTLSVNKALRKAQSHLKAGALVEAKAIYKEILTKFPKNQKAIRGYRDLYNRINGATLETLEPPQEKIQEMLRLFEHGHLVHLHDKATEISAKYPKSVLIFNILGMTNAGLAKLDAAVDSFQRHSDATCEEAVQNAE